MGMTPASGPAARERPVVVLRPAPQQSATIFRPTTRGRLDALFEVVDLEGRTDEALDPWLPEAFAIVGQPDLPAERLDRAPRLRAVLNVEGNFYPNIDYEACSRRGIRVLGCGPAYADAVAEYALGLAIDLARGITREDRAFRAGRERWVAAGNMDSVLLRGASIGFLGYGNLGRATHRLLLPFAATIQVYDPWLPASVIRAAGLLPESLETVLAESDFLFVFATVTAESERLLDAERLDMLRQGARLILVSRAAVTDHSALVERIALGRLQAAIDVWPTEPAPPDEPARTLEGAILSAHRAGGIPAAFFEIGEMVVDDLELIARGLPPVRMQVAEPELAGRYRNRPVDPDRA